MSGISAADLQIWNEDLAYNQATTFLAILGALGGPSMSHCNLIYIFKSSTQ